MIRINATLRSHRRRLALGVLLLLLAGGVVAAHGALGADHMGMGMGADGGLSAPVAMCLAIVETAAVAVAFLALAFPFRIGGLAPLLLPLPTLAPLRFRTPCSRAGPPFLQVFLR